MAELPRFARERLKAVAPGPHPDANLLAAFAENALIAKERSHVLGHLADCAECRAVLGYAVPERQELPVALPAERNGWARWTVMRWVTLGASAVVIMIAVLVLRPQDWGRKPAGVPEISETSPMIVSRQEEPPAKVPTASNDAPKDQTRSRAKSDAVPKRMAAVSPSELEGSVRQRERVAAEKLKDSLADGRGVAPSASGGIVGGVAQPTQVMPFAQSNQVQQQRSIPGGPYSNIGNQAQTANKLNQPLPRAPAAAPVEPRAAASPVLSKAAVQRAESKETRPTAANETVEVAAAAQAAKAEATDAFQGQLKAVPSQTRGGVALQALTTASATMTWTLSEKGRVIRSLDQGRTWTDVPVGNEVVFRAISANGADVWVGGTRSALFHSTDAGRTWTRVRPATQGRELAGDISRIEFADPLRGTVSTTTGEEWVTADGGKTWSVTKRR